MIFRLRSYLEFEKLHKKLAAENELKEDRTNNLLGKDLRVHIIGAGPASCVAAINLAKAGIAVVIHEQKSDVGSRFNGDYQGIENWSTNMDALEFLSSIGISINFLCDPYSIGTFYGPSMKEHIIKTSKPLFYLIKRAQALIHHV